jgi:hypothetical protein
MGVTPYESSPRASFFTDSWGLGGPLPEMPPARPQRGTSTDEDLGASRKNLSVYPNVAAAFVGRHIWVYRAIFPRGTPESFTGVGASLRGCRGLFRKWPPRTPESSE